MQSVSVPHSGNSPALWAIYHELVTELGAMPHIRNVKHCSFYYWMIYGPWYNIMEIIVTWLFIDNISWAFVSSFPLIKNYIMLFWPLTLFTSSPPPLASNHPFIIVIVIFIVIAVVVVIIIIIQAIHLTQFTYIYALPGHRMRSIILFWMLS